MQKEIFEIKVGGGAKQNLIQKIMWEVFLDFDAIGKITGIKFRILWNCVLTFFGALITQVYKI